MEGRNSTRQRVRVFRTFLAVPGVAMGALELTVLVGTCIGKARLPRPHFREFQVLSVVG